MTNRKHKPTEVIELEIEDEDFKDYLTEVKDDPNSRSDEKTVAAGALDRFMTQPREEIEKSNDAKEDIRRFLPKIIAKKIADRVPDGFVLSQIKFNGEIKGQPFGIGVGGSVEVLFEKPK
jgi:hypothetical protein